MKKHLGALALVTAAVFAATGADNGGCTQNDGVGYYGTVVSRTQDKKLNTYRLVINDKSKGRQTFIVPRSDYSACSPGEAYPNCRVKW